MGQKRNLKIIDKSSNSVWFLLFGVSSVTLFIKTDFYDPFNSAKLILLLLICGWLLSHLINSYKTRPITLRSNEFIIIVLVLGFVLSLLVSLVKTDIFIVGLIGDTQRRNGFLAYFALSIIFLFASRSINFSNIVRVYKVGILTGLVASSYGVLQLTGKDFIAWDNPNNSMISTVGNPNFASAILAVLLCISLSGAFLKDLHMFFKLLIILVTSLTLIAIIISGSRQGLLVIFFSFLFYISVYSFMKNQKMRFLVFTVAASGAMLALLGMLQKGPLVSLLYKDSVSVRGYYWRAGIEMFKHSPLTGIGVDRYGVFFKQFREVGYPLKYGFEITSSNAHNTFIQMFATSGMFVGIFYILIISYIFLSGIKLLKQCEPEEQKMALGLLSAWVGFQAQSLISIDNIGLSVWGWLLGGSILGLKYSQNEKSNEISIGRNTNILKINVFQPVVSLFLLLPIVIFTTHIYKFEHDMYVLRGLSNPASPDNKPVVLQYANKVLDNPVSDPFYNYRITFFLYDVGLTQEAYILASKMLASDPRNVFFLSGVASLEELENNVTNTISIRKQIALVDPWNADNYLQLLKVYKASGDLVSAAAMQNKILSFAAKTDIAKTALEILG